MYRTVTLRYRLLAAGLILALGLPAPAFALRPTEEGSAPAQLTRALAGLEEPPRPAVVAATSSSRNGVTPAWTVERLWALQEDTIQPDPFVALHGLIADEFEMMHAPWAPGRRVRLRKGYFAWNPREATFLEPDGGGETAQDLLQAFVRWLNANPRNPGSTGSQELDKCVQHLSTLTIPWDNPLARPVVAHWIHYKLHIFALGHHRGGWSLMNALLAEEGFGPLRARISEQPWKTTYYDTLYDRSPLPLLEFLQRTRAEQIDAAGATERLVDRLAATERLITVEDLQSLNGAAHQDGFEATATVLGEPSFGTTVYPRWLGYRSHEARWSSENAFRVLGPPHEIPQILEEFVRWLNAMTAGRAIPERYPHLSPWITYLSDEGVRWNHPVDVAAAAHWMLFSIHPFSDGNRRTALALMNALLRRSGYSPVTISEFEWRERYTPAIYNPHAGVFLQFIRAKTSRAGMEEGRFTPAVPVYVDAEGHRRIRWSGILPRPRRMMVRLKRDELRGKVFLTGGFVRDLLLGREPSDIDLVAVHDARLSPHQIRDLYLDPPFELWGELSVDEGDPHIGQETQIDVLGWTANLSSRTFDPHLPDFSFNQILLGFDDQADPADPLLLDFFGGYEDLFPVHGTRRGHLVGEVRDWSSNRFLERFLRFAEDKELSLRVDADSARQMETLHTRITGSWPSYILEGDALTAHALARRFEEWRTSYAGLEEAGNRFGPVSPAEELKKRRDRFRTGFLAAETLGHRGTGADLDTALGFIHAKLSSLAHATQLDLAFIEEEESQQAIDLYRNVRAEAGRQWEAQAAPEPIQVSTDRSLTVLMTRMVRALDNLDNLLISGTSYPPTLNESIDQLPEDRRDASRRYLTTIGETLKGAREFLRDRIAFAHGRNPDGAVASFADIKDQLSSRYGARVVIEVAPEAETARVAMTSVRLFSLVNNLVHDAVQHSPDDAPVLVRFGRTSAGELELTVSDHGAGIPAEYFSPTTEGMIRLFTLEGRDGRIPLGMAEVWDTVGIAGGRLAVETRRVAEHPDDHGTTFTIWLPLVSDAAATPMPPGAGLEEPARDDLGAQFARALALFHEAQETGRRETFRRVILQLLTLFEYWVAEEVPFDAWYDAYHLLVHAQHALATAAPETWEEGNLLTTDEAPAPSGELVEEPVTPVISEALARHPAVIPPDLRPSVAAALANYRRTHGQRPSAVLRQQWFPGESASDEVELVDRWWESSTLRGRVLADPDLPRRRRAVEQLLELALWADDPEASEHPIRTSIQEVLITDAVEADAHHPIDEMTNVYGLLGVLVTVEDYLQAQFAQLVQGSNRPEWQAAIIRFLIQWFPQAGRQRLLGYLQEPRLRQEVETLEAQLTRAPTNLDSRRQLVALYDQLRQSYRGRGGGAAIANAYLCRAECQQILLRWLDRPQHRFLGRVTQRTHDQLLYQQLMTELDEGGVTTYRKQYLLQPRPHEAMSDVDPLILEMWTVVFLAKAELAGLAGQADEAERFAEEARTHVELRRPSSRPPHSADGQPGDAGGRAGLEDLRATLPRPTAVIMEEAALSEPWLEGLRQAIEFWTADGSPWLGHAADPYVLLEVFDRIMKIDRYTLPAYPNAPADWLERRARLLRVFSALMGRLAVPTSRLPNSITYRDTGGEFNVVDLDWEFDGTRYEVQFKRYRNAIKFPRLLIEIREGPPGAARMLGMLRMGIDPRNAYGIHLDIADRAAHNSRTEWVHHQYQNELLTIWPHPPAMGQFVNGFMGHLRSVTSRQAELEEEALRRARAIGRQLLSSSLRDPTLLNGPLGQVAYFLARGDNRQWPNLLQWALHNSVTASLDTILAGLDNDSSHSAHLLAAALRRELRAFIELEKVFPAGSDPHMVENATLEKARRVARRTLEVLAELRGLTQWRELFLGVDAKGRIRTTLSLEAGIHERTRRATRRLHWLENQLRELRNHHERYTPHMGWIVTYGAAQQMGLGHLVAELTRKERYAKEVPPPIPIVCIVGNAAEQEALELAGIPPEQIVQQTGEQVAEALEQAFRALQEQHQAVESAVLVHIDNPTVGEPRLPDQLRRMINPIVSVQVFVGGLDYWLHAAGISARSSTEGALKESIRRYAGLEQSA